MDVYAVALGGDHRRKRWFRGRDVTVDVSPGKAASGT
jgi:hypothetical protein